LFGDHRLKKSSIPFDVGFTDQFVGVIDLFTSVVSKRFGMVSGQGGNPFSIYFAGRKRVYWKSFVGRASCL
jgi:hypothetical protein